MPDEDSRVWGEVFELNDSPTVLAALDEIEGYSPEDPDTSLYLRRRVRVHLDDDTTADAWVYFYNAPLGHAHAYFVRRLPRASEASVDKIPMARLKSGGLQLQHGHEPSAVGPDFSRQSRPL